MSTTTDEDAEYEHAVMVVRRHLQECRDLLLCLGGSEAELAATDRLLEHVRQKYPLPSERTP